MTIKPQQANGGSIWQSIDSHRKIWKRPTFSGEWIQANEEQEETFTVETTLNEYFQIIALYVFYGHVTLTLLNHAGIHLQHKLINFNSIMSEY